jgi:hypothetical protein
MVRIRDVDTRAYHVSVSDRDLSAGVDHHVTIEVVAITDDYAGNVGLAIVWPEPAAFRKRISISDADLVQPTTANPFHSVLTAHF